MPRCALMRPARSAVTPVQPSTVITPLIQGCGVQKYENVPASSNVYSNSSSPANNPESNNPSDFSDRSIAGARRHGVHDRVPVRPGDGRSGSNGEVAGKEPRSRRWDRTLPQQWRFRSLRLLAVPAPSDAESVAALLSAVSAANTSGSASPVIVTRPNRALVEGADKSMVHQDHC